MNCYIRVDANAQIGVGHLVRTEILADKLSASGFTVTFLCKSIPDTFFQKIISKGYNVKHIPPVEKELSFIISSVSVTGQDILIVDSDIEEFYTEEFQVTVRESDIRLMLITFYNQFQCFADILLNQNIMALSQQYDCEVHTRKLLGPQFVILKEEYQIVYKSISQYKNQEKGKTILLTFGGIDEPDRTSFIYKALLQIQPVPAKIILVLGAMYKHRVALENLVENSPVNTELYQDTPRMPYLFAETDIVFNSGGLTVWESGVLGALNIIMGHSNREQTSGMYAGDNGYAMYLGTKQDYSVSSLSKKINSILRQDNQKIIARLSECIDVKGVNKVAETIKNTLAMNK